MLEKPFFPAEARDGRFVNRIAGFFWAVLAAAVVLALLILVLPGPVFLAISNYLQILTAMVAAAEFLYLWKKERGQEYLLYAAAALGLWGISNIAWYGLVIFGKRTEVFPGIIDLGMIAAILLLAIAFRKGPASKQTPPLILIGTGIVCLLIPTGVVVTAGISAASLVTFLYFIACEFLIVTALDHTPAGHPKIGIGAFLFALAFMLYPLREIFLVTNPALSVIGTFVSAGFALIVIGTLEAGLHRKNP